MKKIPVLLTFCRVWAATQISTANRAEITRPTDRPGQLAYEIFGIKQFSLSPII